MTRWLTVLAVIIGVLVVVGIGVGFWIERVGVFQVSAAVNDARPWMLALRTLLAAALIGLWPWWAPRVANRFGWSDRQQQQLLRARWPSAVLLVAVEAMTQLGPVAHFE